MKNIHLQEIEIFLEVAKQKNFSKAAQTLYISQPTVTKWLKHLETELEFPLFIRNSKSVKLTPSGEILFERWSALLFDFNDSISAATAVNPSLQTILRVGALEGYDFERFIEYISPFEQENPHITIDFNIYSLRELQELTNQLDVILSNNLEIKYLHKYNKIILDTMPLYLALGRNHRLASKASVTIDEIKDENFFILPPPRSEDGVSYAKEIFAKHGLSPHFSPVENVSSQFIKIWQNKGVCITHEYTVKGFEKNIVLVPIENSPFSIHRLLAYATDKASFSMELFCDYVKQVFAV